MTETHLLLDISRLLSRAERPAPTGIDRVELAYAEKLLRRPPTSVSFVARGPLREITLLPRRLVEPFVRGLGRRWRGEPNEAGPPVESLAWKLRIHLVLHREWELHVFLRAPRRKRAAYLLVSHADLDRPASIERLKRYSGVRFICLVHDLIPMELPHFAGEGQAERHHRRMTTVARLADEVLVNSTPTASAFLDFCRGLGRSPPVEVAPLGVQAPASPPPPPAPGGPYFVVLATIEPKKNHIMLLDIWRRLAAEEGQPPRLVLIGQRGWKTEAIAEALARSDLPPGAVTEHNALSDDRVQALLSGARALLAPSLAEGFGLPVGEALALNVPVVCSDIPAHRYVGGDAPDYLPASDADAWLQAVRDYSASDSLRRRAQLARIGRWRAPSWDDHFEQVLPVLSGCR